MPKKRRRKAFVDRAIIIGNQGSQQAVVDGTFRSCTITTYDDYCYFDFLETSDLCFGLDPDRTGGRYYPTTFNSAYSSEKWII